MKWGNQGMPKDMEMLNNLRVLFSVSLFNSKYIPSSLVFFKHIMSGADILVEK